MGVMQCCNLKFCLIKSLNKTATLIYMRSLCQRTTLHDPKGNHNAPECPSIRSQLAKMCGHSEKMCGQLVKIAMALKPLGIF